MKKPIKPKQLESQIQNTILEYLAIKEKQGKLLFWRHTPIPVFDIKTGSFRSMPKHAKKGLPDIFVVKDGFIICIEVKQPSGRQSEDQKKFEKLIKENGAEYHVVTRLEDLAVIGL